MPEAAAAANAAAHANAPGTRPIKVWDLPTRLFHWSLVALVAFSYLSVQLGWMDLHFLSGYAILAAVAFRLVWGLVGSQTARFAQFMASPREALRHLSHITRRDADTQIGHNPAGGWVVLAMLALLLVQAGTGLFSRSSALVYGPLSRSIGRAASDSITGLHAVSFKLVLALVVMHVAAVAAYGLLRRHDLVRPMVTGVKRLPASLAAPRMASPALAAAVFAAAVAAVVLLVKLA